MAVTNKVTVATSNGGFSVASELTGNAGGPAIDVALAGSTTNQTYEIAIKYADLKQLVLFADGTLTIKGNSTGSPDYTWTMAANAPVVWCYGSPQANPFGTVDTTIWYLTNASGSTVNLKGYVLQQHT